MATAAIWDKRSKLYDVCAGPDLRWGHHKEALFRHMRGRVLFVAIGTGLDVAHFPPGAAVIGIDISNGMLAKAAGRASRYEGKLNLVRADAMTLCFPDQAFDTVVTSCTMCSVPDPGVAFRELYRVLRPGGRLLMFEHMRSGNLLLGLVLDMMTFATRRGGTDMNRTTLKTAAAAGFRLKAVASVFLDIVLSIQAVKDAGQPGPIG